MYKAALVFGRAEGVWGEIEEAKRLYAFDLTVAVGSAGVDYPGHIDCWVTYHANKFPQWVQKRETRKRPAAGALWTARSGLRYKPTLHVNKVDGCEGADSGLIGVVVAMRMARKVVLAGIPMDPERGQYDSPGSYWDEGLRHRDTWLKFLPEMRGRVTSMSGWTKEILNGGQ
jgi:hypothetical protein